MAWRPERDGFRRKWSLYKGPKYHLLVPSQYMGGGPQVKGIRGCGLAVGRKKGSILRFPLKLLWEKCPTRMASHPNACHRGRWGRGLILIQVRVVRTEEGKKQDKPFCLGIKNGATNTFSVIVVVGQPTGQWAVLEGHPQGAKSNWGVKAANPFMADNMKGGSCEQ